MFKIKLLGFVPQPNLQFIKKLIMSRDALVIGINTYSYERLNNLTAPGQDAEAVAKLLENYGDFKVTRLPAVKDKQNNTVRVGQKTKVTLNHLENTIIQLFTPDGKPPDTALLYFSGHGLRKSKGRIQEGFLASSDVNPDVGNWGLSLQWLRRLLQESEVRQQIIILDCCYAGEVLNIAEADPGDRGKGRDRCFIAAARAFEVAFEEVGSNHSVLTAALIKGLEPKQDRWVTNLTLVDLVNQERNAFPQRPTFSNSGEPINLTRRFTAVTNIPPPSGQGICPYKGLAYFDCTEEDAKYFYGRTALTDELLEKVRVGNFLAVLGASGSGKSSVVRAGLLYQLQLGRRLSGSESWQIKIFQPGEHPLNSLALAFLDSELSDIERATQLAQAEELIKKGSEGLRQIISVADTPKLLLVVDQFEEAFTLCQDTSERQKFFACLFDALPKTDKLCLVLTMRADFFSKCIEQEYSGLAQLMQQHGVVVMGMSKEELKKAIVEPAKQVDLEIEPALVEQILADVADAPGYLPLLQYTLTRLWEERTDNCLQLNTYVQLGGVMGTLRQRADEVYEGFSEEEKAAARYIFLELT
nr:caspase family protein [Okeania sp. SIO2C2]